MFNLCIKDKSQQNPISYVFLPMFRFSSSCIWKLEVQYVKMTQSYFLAFVEELQSGYSHFHSHLLDYPQAVSPLGTQVVRKSICMALVAWVATAVGGACRTVGTPKQNDWLKTCIPLYFYVHAFMSFLFHLYPTHSGLCV